MDFVGITSKVRGRVAHQVAALCCLIWFAISAFSAFSQSTLGEAAGACGFPTDGIFTGSATYELSADCDLSAIVERGSTWTIAAGVDITIEGNGYSLIAGRRGSGFPFTDATFLTIIIDTSSTLTLSNIVFDSIRMRVNGVLTLGTSPIPGLAITGYTFLAMPTSTARSLKTTSENREMGLAAR